MLRVFLAFLLMPPIASILLGAAIALTNHPDPEIGDRFGLFLVIAAGATAMSYQVELLLSLPVHLLLKKLNLVKWHHYFLVGTVINIPVALLLTIASLPEISSSENFVFFLMAMGYGCLMMTILWLMLYWSPKTTPS